MSASQTRLLEEAEVLTTEHGVSLLHSTFLSHQDAEGRERRNSKIFCANVEMERL